MNIQDAQSQLVTVNGGSGCIIQPMTDEYLYVLTARHNIAESHNQLTEFTRFEFRNQQWVALPIRVESFEEGIDFFVHPDKDIAIIKILPIEGSYSITRIDDLWNNRKNFHLCGFPEVRRTDQEDKSQWYRTDPNIEILDPRGGQTFEAIAPGNAVLAEMRGNSGGALLQEKSGQVFLAGIQNQMAEEDEQLGRFRFTSISAFDEIIALHPQSLAPILPCFLKSFSFLGSEVFNLIYGPKTQAKGSKLTQILRAKAQEFAASDLVPHEIKKYIKENLPVFHKQEGYDNYQRKIWAIWLELLTILNVVKSKAHALSDFPEIARKVRFFYSNTNRDFWEEHLSDLHKRDYSGLDEDAIVVVASNTQAADEFHILSISDIPTDIYQVKKSKLEYQLERIGISTIEGTDFPLEKYKFLNISAFKEGAIRDIEDSFTEEELAHCIDTLKNLYGKLIPTWGPVA